MTTRRQGLILSQTRSDTQTMAFEEDYDPWDADFDTSNASLNRLIRALIECDARLLNHFRLSPLMGRAVTVFCRVSVPRQNKERFLEISKPIRMEAPKKTSID